MNLKLSSVLLITNNNFLIYVCIKHHESRFSRKINLQDDFPKPMETVELTI